jgi:predicted nucleic acid-binding protein
MKKLKIYLDTSVISHLDAPDVPDKEADTKRLWEEIKAGRYEVFISPVVVLELSDCYEPKLSGLLAQMDSICYTTLDETDEILELALKYIDAGILRKKSINDCRHIAYACVSGCDMVVSWNFKHLVNIKTINGVKGVNALAGYREMPIYTPTFFIGGEPEDDT